MDWFHWIGLGFSGLLMVIGWCLVLLAMPGTIVILLAALIAGWATQFETMSSYLIGGLVGMTVVAELADNALALYGARKFGTSKKGQLASVLGSIAGALLGGVLFGMAGGFVLTLLLGAIGSLLGALAGGYGAIYWVERRAGRSRECAMRAAKGALIGRILGMGLRIVIAAVMTFVTCNALWKALA